MEDTKRKYSSSLLRANEALKKYTRRSKAAKAVDKQMWNVVLAGGCRNKLDDLVKALERRYA